MSKSPDSDFSDKRLQVAVEAAGIGIWDYNLQTGDIFWNNIARQHIGVPDDVPLCMQEYMELVHPDDRDMVNQAFLACLDPTAGKPFEATYRIQNPLRAQNRWLHSSGKALFDGDNKPYHFIGSTVDVTEQKMIEEALRKSNAQFIHLADSLPQIVWEANADGEIVYFNKQWYQYSGFDAKMNHADWTIILHPDDLNFCLNTWHEAVRTGNPYQIEYRFKDRKTGGYRWFLGRAYPIKDAEEKIVSWLGTCTDIHDQKLMMADLENRVKARTAELQITNNRLTRVNRSLERKNKEMEQLAWIASHDLKEPLRKIRTFMSALNVHLKTPDDITKNYLQKMENCAERMTQLITDILNFSQLNMVEGNFEEVDLNEVIQEVVVSLNATAHQKGAQIFVPHLPKVYGIRLQMTQLFYNLLHNSLKFSKPDTPPVIHITCQPLSTREAISIKQIDHKIPYHRITIADNGIGFDDQYANKVFDIFQRLHAKANYDGTGIGLSLCKKIAHNHQGELLARSKSNVGTRMVLILPQLSASGDNK